MSVNFINLCVRNCTEKSSFRIAGCYSLRTETIHPGHVGDELIEELQKGTATPPWHINNHIQMLEG